MGALNFRSRLAPYIIGLIEQKRALGYKYTAQVKILQKFDMLCAERFSEDSTVTKAMLDVWAVKGPEEAPGTCPYKYIPREAFLPMINQDSVDDSTEKWLDNIESRLYYERWYCGHWHISKRVDKLHFLFHDFEIAEE